MLTFRELRVVFDTYYEAVDGLNADIRDIRARVWSLTPDATRPFGASTLATIAEDREGI